MNYLGLARLVKDMLNNDVRLDFTSSATPSLRPYLDDTRISFGDGTYSFDFRVFGNLSTDYLDWDASASKFSAVGATVVDVPAGQLQIGSTAITATAAEINAAADVSGRIVNVTDAATYAVLAANSGKPHIMPDFTATCTLTMPTAAAGLEYEFYSKAVAADAQDWRFSTGGANFWLGGLAFADTDAGAGADEISAGVFPNGTSNDFITIVTPGAGTRIKVLCDGTNWIVSGIVFSATTPAFADT